jgi:hypothetical protein
MDRIHAMSLGEKARFRFAPSTSIALPPRIGWRSAPGQFDGRYPNSRRPGSACEHNQGEPLKLSRRSHARKAANLQIWEVCFRARCVRRGLREDWSWYDSRLVAKHPLPQNCRII